MYNRSYYIHHNGWRVAGFTITRSRIDFGELREVNPLMLKVGHDGITVRGKAVRGDLEIFASGASKLLGKRMGILCGAAAKMPSLVGSVAEWQTQRLVESILTGGLNQAVGRKAVRVRVPSDLFTAPIV